MGALAIRFVAPVFALTIGATTALQAVDPAPPPVPVSPPYSFSVAVDGDFLAVGDHLFENHNIGGVHLYQRVGTSWKHVTLLIPPDGQLDDTFGFSVALEGDLMVVGAPQLSVFSGGWQRGAAYIYRLTLGDQDIQWLLEEKIDAPGAPFGNHFGYSVAISNGVIVVGQTGEVEPPTQGAAHVYRRESTLWALEGTLSDSSAGPGDGFGHSVSISGDIVVVGVPDNITFYGRTGSAFVFRKQPSGWVKQQKLFGTGLSNYDRFGSAVSVDHELIVVGADLADGASANSGKVFSFREDGGQWVEGPAIVNPDGQPSDRFGAKLQLRASILVVGAPEEARNEPTDGAVYLFERHCDQWDLKSRIVSGDSWYGISFGASLSLDRSTLAIASVGPAYVSSLASSSALARFADFQNCFGSALAVESPCSDCDFVSNGQVDLADFACIEFAPDLP